MDNKLVVVRGPSGSGKDTLLNIFLNKHSNDFEIVRTYTSRKPRNKNDRYNFISKKEFIKMEKMIVFLKRTVITGITTEPQEKI